MGFIDTMRAEGHAVESVCRVLREQGCQFAARTYRAARVAVPAARTVSDAQVVNTVRDLAWTVDHTGRRRLTPEGLYGRRKMAALVRRAMPEATPGSVDRAIRTLGLRGIRRSKAARTTIPAKGGVRAGDLLDRDFTAAAPNQTWVMDFTYVRTWAGFVYVAFILDIFAQKIVAWNAATTKTVELVDTPLRIAVWQRDRDGHPVVRGDLIGHADAGSQVGFNRSSQHLDFGGVQRWQRQTGARRPATRPRGFVGSGVLTAR
ncbi:MAG: DDE-type integrase/transposase/recombinase [Austwickia sp.]|nr:DDE-type integrase/transposase/recombinase [Austwickia sp.]MBK9100945.1 DDE-type integrase/transposase/recombinase [Austwickia sp.]